MFHSNPHAIVQGNSTPLVSNRPANIGLSIDEQIKAAKCREMALSLDRKRRMEKKRATTRPNIGLLTLCDLENFLSDTYDRHGPSMPEGDDAASEHFVVLLHYVAQLGDPSAMRAAKDRWCPWLSEAEYAAMIAAVERKRLRWDADGLAAEIGLDYATRTRLGITAIGATDFCQRKRTQRRNALNNADKRARRAAAGAAPHALSAERTKPWLDLGISRATYNRRLKLAREKREPDSGTAASFSLALAKSGSPADQGAARSALTRSACGGHAAADLIQSPAIAETGRDSADAGRLCLHWIKKGKNPFDNLSRKTLASQDMDRAA
jgi:hypothetical protein